MVLTAILTRLSPTPNVMPQV